VPILFFFYVFFFSFFKLLLRARADRRTDIQTDGQDAYCGRVINKNRIHWRNHATAGGQERHVLEYGALCEWDIAAVVGLSSAGCDLVQQRYESSSLGQDVRHCRLRLNSGRWNDAAQNVEAQSLSVLASV